MRLRTDSAVVVLPRPFTRLEVLGADSLQVRVRCAVCPEVREGRVERAEVVFEPPSPETAAGEGLAEFALAVREAARRHELGALRSVMVVDFTFSFFGLQGADRALAAWEAERFAALDRVPELLDRGLATKDSVLWAAPPEHFERMDYRGLRLGFRRSPEGRWEWVFLIGSE